MLDAKLNACVRYAQINQSWAVRTVSEFRGRQNDVARRSGEGVVENGQRDQARAASGRATEGR